jgi:tetratricopeptide (TPR) repeat protein
LAKYAEYDQVWIVKSAGLVLGPFSFVELTQALKDKTVSLLDEVRTPTTRWGFVRETPQLTELVKIIRETESKQSGRTARLIIDGNTDSEGTESISATLKMIETTPAPVSAFSDELTRPISTIPATVEGKKNNSQNSARVIAGVVPQPHGQIEIPTFKNRKANILALIKSKKFLTLGAAAIVVLYLAVFFALPGKRHAVRSEGSSAELFKLAQRMKSIGFYDKALMMYERALGTKPADPLIKYEMLPLYLQSESGTGKAQQLAKELVNDHSLTPDMLAKVSNWSGIALMRQRLFPAAEAQFANAEREFPMFTPIGINRAVNQYFLGQLQESIVALEALKDHGIAHPLIPLTQALATLYLPSEKLSTTDLKNIIDELARGLSLHRDFATVSLLFIASLQDRGGANEEVNKTINRILEETPGIDRAYAHDLDEDFSVISWSRIKGVCENLAARHAMDAPGMALSVFCKIENEDWNAATGALNTALQRYPEDQHLLALQGVILKNQGNGHDAKDILANNQTRTGLLVRSQICLEEKDLPCSEAALQALLSKDGNDPEALTGLVQLDLLRNKRDLAQQTAERALSSTSNFRPLVEIREEMGEL